MTKKAIGLKEYKELSEEQQLDILHRDGVYVGKRKVEKLTVVLFQLYGFYVEVFYKRYRREIDATVATDNADVLHPYINQVNIRDLDNRNNEA